MPETDLHQPDLSLLLAADEAAELLRAFGCAIALFGSDGAWLVTGCHRQETEAGR